MLIVLIVAGVLVLVAAALLWIGVALRRQRAAFLDRIGSEGVVRHDAANFFGRGSAGGAQVRGSGILVLTLRALHFEMMMPRREITVPLEAITGVDTPRSFAGKTDTRRLLVVRYRDPESGEDEVAWSVRDVEDWVRDLGPPPARPSGRATSP